MSLTSIEFSAILRWFAYKSYTTNLNKTQVNKLLFMWYGLYLAQTGKLLFEDDKPKAWPYGPVFPRVYKKFSQIPFPVNLSTHIKEEIVKDEQALYILQKIIPKYFNMSAIQLSEWSHKKGSPWYKTIYGDSAKGIQWNQIIKDELIKDYFQKP